MKKRYQIILLLVTFGITLFTPAWPIDDGPEKKLYNSAQKNILANKWTEALNKFQELVDEFPTSPYRDDSRFWIGYCLEKMDRPQEAFLSFEKLIKEYPNSPWVDDGVMHQITLAEKLARAGNSLYLLFLVEKLSEPDPIRKQAAIALGKLGDSRAMPILKEIENDVDFGPLAKSLIGWIESGQKAPIIAPGKSEPPIQLEFMREGIEVGSEKAREEKSRSFFFPTRRYRQYRSMLKKGDDWSRQELVDFAMWQTLPTDEFEKYNSLQGYDRSEWLRKYWKKLDPTPTTEENEAKAEFERRIEYARIHFADFWEYRHFRYLKDEWLKFEWEHAPWDARGEIYIKYGEPDFRAIEAFHKEEWTYYRYNVDFIINQYMTNIYGNAISPGALSRSIHHDFSTAYVEFNFIYNPEFRYHHDYQATPIKNFELSIEKDFQSESGNVRVTYSVKTNEFKITSASNQFTLRFLQTHVILNPDLRVVEKNETMVEMVRADKNSFKKEKKITRQLTFKLLPGEYTLALQIKDQASDKLGIYTKNFIVAE